MRSPALFRVAAAGGAPAVVAMGMGLDDPTDVTVGGAMRYFTLDTGRGTATGRTATVTATVAFGLANQVAAFPAGIAASRDGNLLLVSAWAAGATNRLTCVRADGTMPMPVTGMGLVSPVGIGRARTLARYAIADELAGVMGMPTNGAIFVAQ